MHAITGTHKGIEFRSKHELSWARLKCRAQLEWSYEPTRFIDGRQSYTPDFLIAGVYVEIKAMGAKRLNRFELCQERLLLIYGLPDRQHYIRFKPAGAERFDLLSLTWRAAYQRFFA